MRHDPGTWTTVAVVVCAVVVILIGTAPATTTVQASLLRVREDEAKTEIVREAAAAGCPQLDNPGGRLSWDPSPDAGPFATNGTVVLPTQGIEAPIVRVGVEAPIVRVGVDETGAMVVPTNARDIAWLDEGPLRTDARPGAPMLGRTNNIVLAGHIDYDGVVGSFGGLQRLRPGDTVAVSMDGKVWVFEIKWSCLFDRNTPLASRIMGYTETPSVTLISCGGVWDPSAGTHDKRVAVRGELIKVA
jgi:hypothetical protein